jgi:hypothetical protein
VVVLSWVLVLGLGLGAVSGEAAAALEEVLAVVDRTPILRSDIELARLVGLAEPAADEIETELRSRLLDLRLRLELQLRDLESTGVLYRLKPDQDAALAELVRRAGGEERLRVQLPALGLAWSDVESLALRVAVASAYVEQRLRPRIAVSLEEMEREYQRLVSEELVPQGAPVPPFSELRDQLHRLLSERKLNAEIERWTDQAAERLGVTRFVR